MGRAPVYFIVFQLDRSFSGTVDTGDEIKDGRLAGAIGPDQSPNLAGINLKIIIVNRPEPAKIVRHLLNLQQCHYLPRAKEEILFVPEVTNNKYHPR